METDMYTEVVPNISSGVARLREGIDPLHEWFTDDNLRRILVTSSLIIDRAVVKCLLGIEQKAKQQKQSDKVVQVRNMLSRFEAGLIKI